MAYFRKLDESRQERSSAFSIPHLDEDSNSIVEPSNVQRSSFAQKNFANICKPRLGPNNFRDFKGSNGGEKGGTNKGDYFET